MIRFLNTVTTGPQRGLAGYRPRTAPSRTMTAEAMVCRMFLGLPQDESVLREAVAYLLQETPQGGPFNEYYWYYATLALFQLQGPAWEVLQRCAAGAFAGGPGDRRHADRQLAHPYRLGRHG